MIASWAMGRRAYDCRYLGASCHGVQRTGTGRIDPKISVAEYLGVVTPTLAETSIVLGARLNFGDCLSYATAKLAGQPLLYVGEDFTKTDLARA